MKNNYFIIFNCPVCKHQTDITHKKLTPGILHKCEKCEYLFIVHRDCYNNIVFMDVTNETINEIKCPHCELKMAWNEGIEKFTIDFAIDDWYFDEYYQIKCPKCHKPFEFIITRAEVFIKSRIDKELYGEYWELKEDDNKS